MEAMPFEVGFERGEKAGISYTGGGGAGGRQFKASADPAYGRDNGDRKEPDPASANQLEIQQCIC